MTRSFGSKGLYSQALGAQLLVTLGSARSGDAARLREQIVGEDRTTAILSAALIIGVPLIFWMGLLEVVSAAVGFGYGMQERLIVGGLLVAFLFVIRGCAREAGR